MEPSRIVKEMQELQEKLGYKFNNIHHLAKAMCAIRVKVEGAGKNNREYKNEPLATVGDAILKVIIADWLFSSGRAKTKKEISKAKEKYENNDVLYKLDIEEGFISYSYNEFYFQSEKNIPDHKKVVRKKHDPYIEAIVGAIYYDSNFDTVKDWVITILIPLIEKYISH